MDISGKYFQSGEYLFVKEKDWGESISEAAGDHSHNELMRLYESGHSNYTLEFLKSRDEDELDDESYSLLIKSACRAKDLETLSSANISRLDSAFSRALLSLATGGLELALSEIEGLEGDPHSMFLKVAMLCKTGEVKEARAVAEEMLASFGNNSVCVAAQNLACAYAENNMGVASDLIMR